MRKTCFDEKYIFVLFQRTLGGRDLDGLSLNNSCYVRARKYVLNRAKRP